MRQLTEAQLAALSCQAGGGVRGLAQLTPEAFRREFFHLVKDEPEIAVDIGLALVATPREAPGWCQRIRNEGLGPERDSAWTV